MNLTNTKVAVVEIINTESNKCTCTYIITYTRLNYTQPLADSVVFVKKV